MRCAVILMMLATLVHGCGERAAGPSILDITLELGPAIAENGVHRLELDHTHSLDSGFIVPPPSPVGGYFHVHFKLRDPLERAFRYAIFYQNTSYAFPNTDLGGGQHPNAWENFYGSWEPGGDAFHRIAASAGKEIIVTDSFRIAGDPRAEDRFRVEGRRMRWARNPRVGRYEFMLVVMPEDLYAKLPPSTTDIRVQDTESYVDPFWYYVDGPGARDEAITVHRFNEQLHLTARPDLGSGIFARPSEGLTSDAFNELCGNTPGLEASAPFEQFIHYVDGSTRFENIPLIADVLGNEFTPDDHDHYAVYFPPDRMIPTLPATTRSPCSTVRSDPEGHYIELRNPRSSFGDERKENVGVRSRNGLLYGRHRIKCALTPLLNDSGMWVGLTNAIWLIYQGAPGNLRRICSKDGYMATYWGGPDDDRVPQVDYAEIDFEILKTPPYCPDNAFPPFRAQTWTDHGDRNSWSRKSSDPRRDLITVACTNWDMACHDPEGFDVGCHPLVWGDSTFLNHRWDHDYRAVTQKSDALDKELFDGEHYWFEIDWRPTEIIWRIGPDPDHMRVVGYMNDQVTSIPNVQMQLIVTQEFHNTKWWPGSPFDQGFVPFPAKDYVGRILEVVIE